MGESPTFKLFLLSYMLTWERHLRPPVQVKIAIEILHSEC